MAILYPRVPWFTVRSYGALETTSSNNYDNVVYAPHSGQVWELHLSGDTLWWKMEILWGPYTDHCKIDIRSEPSQL